MLQITNPKRFYLIIGGAVLLVFFLAWRAAWGVGTILHDGQIEIVSGTGASALWQQLVKDGYTTRSLPWKYYGWQKEASKKLQAGTYVVSKGEKVKDIVERFVQGDVTDSEVAITYPEGFTLKQIAARTAARGIGSEKDFIAQANVALYAEKFSYLKDLPAGRSLEGYLFPDTYRVFPDDTPQDVIERMLGNFDKKITDDIVTEAKSQGRTLDQIVIMASIIEREVNRTADLPKVADVLWKRFDDNVGLGADATVRYALNKWDGPLTIQDLALDSPFNTRKYRGLPPEAIGNPGIPAIMAALRPEKTDAYYYLSAPDGTTIFSKNLDEHNANKIKYLR